MTKNSNGDVLFDRQYGDGQMLMPRTSLLALISISGS